MAFLCGAPSRDEVIGKTVRAVDLMLQDGTVLQGSEAHDQTLQEGRSTIYGVDSFLDVGDGVSG